MLREQLHLQYYKKIPRTIFEFAFVYTSLASVIYGVYACFCFIIIIYYFRFLLSVFRYSSECMLTRTLLLYFFWNIRAQCDSIAEMQIEKNIQVDSDLVLHLENALFRITFPRVRPTMTDRRRAASHSPESRIK